MRVTAHLIEMRDAAVPRSEDERSRMILELKRCARAAKRWQQHCDSAAKVCWHVAYVIGMRWIILQFERVNWRQLAWFSLFSGATWQLKAWCHWHEEVAIFLRESARELGSRGTWTFPEEVGDFL